MAFEPSVELLAVVIPLLSRHEGRRLGMYRDPLGIPTIGVGFNLEQPGAALILADVGADYERLIAGAAELTDAQCDELLIRSVRSTANWLAEIFWKFPSFPVNRQAALIDMGFMGQGHFENFKKMIAAIDQGNWPDAGAEAMASKWAVEVGSRAHDDLMLMANR